jgi:hypothetical protein
MPQLLLAYLGFRGEQTLRGMQSPPCSEQATPERTPPPLALAAHSARDYFASGLGLSSHADGVVGDADLESHSCLPGVLLEALQVTAWVLVASAVARQDGGVAGTAAFAQVAWISLA